MRTDQILVGIKGAVVALDRNSGVILWQAELDGSGFVTVLQDGDHVFALTNGEIFCLDARSGARLWHNPLKGYGFGIGSLAVADRSVALAAAAAQLVADQQRDAAASSTPAAS